MERHDCRYLRSLVIYEVFVRNHTPEGTFAAVEGDLERIRSMGVDVVWLMPVHPVGRTRRKGTLGSPYSIADYRAINPEYGSQEDFAHLARKAHALGLKLMIDVVFNHTSYDSVLMAEHPEWYHHDESGHPVSTVPEWSDVIDLSFPNPELERYLIDSLLKWSRLGVDGFRCDVAPRVPLEFWRQARTTVAAEKPETIWLAESEHARHVAARRSAGLRAHSDCELYAAFDLTYDYDIWPVFQAAATHRLASARYLELVRLQESLYPTNAVKMRCVENHDQRRIISLAPTTTQALAWTAFEAFSKGAFLIYAGQESGARHTPSLFERDVVAWGGYEMQDMLTRLARLKKERAVTEGAFTIIASAPVAVAAWESCDGCLLGVFNLDAFEGSLATGLEDGEYEDLISGEGIRIRGGKVEAPVTVCILRYETPTERSWFYTDLLDFDMPPNLS